MTSETSTDSSETGTEEEGAAKEYRERMEAQKVEICIEAQIRAAGEEEEARARATAIRRRRAETERA